MSADIIDFERRLDALQTRAAAEGLAPAFDNISERNEGYRETGDIKGYLADLIGRFPGPQYTDDGEEWNLWTLEILCEWADEDIGISHPGAIQEAAEELVEEGTIKKFDQYYPPFYFAPSGEL